MTTATQPTLTEASVETSKKPVKVCRDRNLSVSIFPNTATVRGKEMTFFNSQIQRSYKDGDEFKATHSLGKDDLLRAAQLLSQAWTWIVDEETSRRKKAATDQPACHNSGTAVRFFAYG